MRKIILQRNWWVLLLALGCICACIKKNINFMIPVVSNPDHMVSFFTDDVRVEQTWQPYVKKINNISIPYKACSNFNATIKLTIFSDDYSQELIQQTKEFFFIEDQVGIIDFDFEVLRVIAGERYHMQMNFEDISQEGELEFPTGSNYGGGIIGREEINEALAMRIGGVKNSGLFFVVALMFPLVTISLLIMVSFKRKWEETIGIALILEVLLLYIFGLLGHIKWGIYSIYLISFVAFGIVIYLFNRQNICLKELLSPGLWVFGILFILIIVGNKDTWYGRFDEYSHWGLAVKDMFYYDSFAKHVDTTVLIPRYLPFATLFEYYCTFLNGVYVEKVVYIAFQVIILSFSVILCRLTKKNFLVFISLILGMICIPPIFFDDVTNCIYVDPLLGIVTMYVLICYYKREAFAWLQIMLGLVALVLIKDMGVILGGLLALTFVTDAIWSNWKNKRIILSQLLFPIMSTIVVILTWFSWQIFMKIPVLIQNESVVGETGDALTENSGLNFTGTVEASGISVGGIWELLTGNASAEKKQVIKNFIVKIFDGDMFYLGSVGFSYMDVMLLCVVVVGILLLIGFWKNNTSKMIHLISLLTIMGIVYCVVLGVMYLFAFPIDEALKLKSIERYLGSFIVAEVMAIWYFISAELCDYEKKDKKVACTAVLMSIGLLVIVPMGNFIIKNKDRSITADMVYWYDNVEEIFRSFAKRGEYSAFECANGGTESYFIFRNAVSPLLSERTNLNIVSSEDKALQQVQWYIEDGSEKINKAEIINQESWINYLKECDYLFILHTDDFFINSYREVFLEPETICDGSIYHVKRDKDDIALSYIGKTIVKKYR